MLKFLQGALIGLGAVLPGISGGVLSVIFGIYRPVMELLANPVRNFKTHIPRLLPYIAGGVTGFLLIARLLAFLLETYPNPSICLFIGLIGGMIPALFKEAGKEGRSFISYVSMFLFMFLIIGLLLYLKSADLVISPGFYPFLFCGFCLALSIIAPGMSFSTLLMPLGLYTPFMDGISRLSPKVLIPACIGAVLTVICFSRAVNFLFKRYYSISFHGILGIVIAATLMIIPYECFMIFNKVFVVNLLCIVIGIFAALLLDLMNQKTDFGL